MLLLSFDPCTFLTDNANCFAVTWVLIMFFFLLWWDYPISEPKRPGPQTRVRACECLCVCACADAFSFSATMGQSNPRCSSSLHALFQKVKPGKRERREQKPKMSLCVLDLCLVKIGLRQALACQHAPTLPLDQVLVLGEHFQKATLSLH